MSFCTCPASGDGKKSSLQYRNKPWTGQIGPMCDFDTSENSFGDNDLQMTQSRPDLRESE